MATGPDLESTLKTLRAGDREAVSDYGLLRKSEVAFWFKAAVALLLAVKIAVLSARAWPGASWPWGVLAVGGLLALHWGRAARRAGRLRREFERSAPPSELRAKGPADFEPPPGGNASEP